MCNLLPVLKEYSAKTFSRDSVNDVAHVVFLFHWFCFNHFSIVHGLWTFNIYYGITE